MTMTVTAASHQSTAAKILLIDDDPNLRLLLSSALTELGYHIITAQDGHEGLTKTTTAHPDIVLVDAVMPELDGIAYCQAIQDYYIQASDKPSETSETPASPGPTILMLTAMATMIRSSVPLRLGPVILLPNQFSCKFYNSVSNIASKNVNYVNA